jgi:small subunit ribosomal protein S6
MAFYEHVFIARQDITASQVEGITADFSKIIEENEGKVAKTEYWGLKNLAYKIKKNRKGHYTLLNIEADHAAVAELERRISLNDDIIRHMTLRVEEHEADESIQMRNKNRDERRSARREEGNYERDAS